MKISLLITAWKEEKSIGTCIETYLGNFAGDFEILLAIPDEKTKNAALEKTNELGITKKVFISDFVKDGKPKGKPAELNELMNKATGDIWFFGDGDTYFGENVIEKVLKHFENPRVTAVTGRPRSSDEKKASKMHYFGHLLTDAAHHKRMIDLTEKAEGHGKSFVAKRSFFPVSGYLFAMRKTDIRAPEDTLVEDAYFSYEIHNRGGIIAYEPEAEVFVKFPKTLSDYYKQKKRSVGGYVQLWKYGVVKPETKTRSFWRELEYFWFPLKYANSFKELMWSLMLYPIRFWLWIQIYKERKHYEKKKKGPWERIESTI